MHKNKDKFKMDYSSFTTEVSKRRRSATTRELSKKILLTILIAIMIESIRDN